MRKPRDSEVGDSLRRRSTEENEGSRVGRCGTCWVRMRWRMRREGKGRRERVGQLHAFHYYFR